MIECTQRIVFRTLEAINAHLLAIFVIHTQLNVNWLIGEVDALRRRIIDGGGEIDIVNSSPAGSAVAHRTWFSRSVQFAMRNGTLLRHFQMRIILFDVTEVENTKLLAGLTNGSDFTMSGRIDPFHNAVPGNPVANDAVCVIINLYDDR